MYQMWLRYDAEIAEQSHCGETVGAALDQKLLVWGAVEEDAPQLFLRAPSVRHGGRQAEEFPSSEVFGTKEGQLFS